MTTTNNSPYNKVQVSASFTKSSALIIEHCLDIDKFRLVIVPNEAKDRPMVDFYFDISEARFFFFSLRTGQLTGGASRFNSDKRKDACDLFKKYGATTRRLFLVDKPDGVYLKLLNHQSDEKKVNQISLRGWHVGILAHEALTYLQTLAAPMVAPAEQKSPAPVASALY